MFRPIVARSLAVSHAHTLSPTYAHKRGCPNTGTYTHPYLSGLDPGPTTWDGNLQSYPLGLLPLNAGAVVTVEVGVFIMLATARQPILSASSRSQERHQYHGG